MVHECGGFDGVKVFVAMKQGNIDDVIIEALLDVCCGHCGFESLENRSFSRRKMSGVDERRRVASGL